MLYDDAWEISLCLRTRADEMEKLAAKFDTYKKEDGYTQESVDWARSCKSSLRARAQVFRAHAKQVLRETSND